MSLGKLPGFKGLAVPGSQGGKQRFRSDLSVDMISPPMADFRHTMHVGRGGDVFGDTSFLSNHGGRREDPPSPDPGFFTRTFRHVRARNPEPRARVCRGGSREMSSSPPPPPISPIIKNAISLPQLNVVDGHSNGCLQRALLFPTSASTNEAFYGYGLPPGFVTLPRLSRMGKGFPEGNVRKDSLVDSDSGGGATPTCSDSLTDLTDFTFDLGPSLMSEVLSMFDRRGGLLGGGVEAEGRGDEEEEEEGVDEEDEEDEYSSSVLQVALESPASSPTTTSTRGSSRASDWTGRAAAPVMGGRDSQTTPAPDASCHSPQGAEPGMGAERFQRASSMLSRHYGGGSFSHPDAASPPPRCLRPAASFSSSRTSEREEEEEIRV